MPLVVSTCIMYTTSLTYKLIVRKSGHARIIICHLHHLYQIRGAHVFWEFLYRLSHGAAEGGVVSHTPNHLEAALRTKSSTEAIELIPEVCTCNEKFLYTLFLYVE